jgi:hypothetical protein
LWIWALKVRGWKLRYFLALLYMKRCSRVGWGLDEVYYMTGCEQVLLAFFGGGQRPSGKDVADMSA